MEYLILGMILAGSALMVYNIIRYALFIKKNRELEQQSANHWAAVIPLLLLIFFLVGYVVVGISGIADVLIASILLGGSIFVSLLLWVMFSIIGHVRDTEQLLAMRYKEIREEIDNLTKDALAIFRVNLTRDEIEERRGDYLYESDFASDKYSEVIEARQTNLVERYGENQDQQIFLRDNLIRAYREGITRPSEIRLVKRRDGVLTYVQYKAMLTKKPVSGDVVAFIVETPCNEEVVRRTLMARVLMDEYDRVAYIIDGHYKVLISNSGKTKKLLLNDEEDSYESVYFNNILPAMSYDPAKNDGKPNPLRLSVIEKELEDKDFYEANAPFVIDGETHYKHFSFYRIEKNAKFFLMLLSDSTKIREEQEKQNRELSEALAAAIHANESRVNFFTNISHNLRTPLNGILGFAELAGREKDPEARQSHLAKIAASGQILLARMNDLFDMSRLESGTLTLETESTDLVALTEGVAADVEKLHAEKKLIFTVDGTGLPEKRALCDPARVAQILLRLTENAAVFSPEGGRIALSVAREEGSCLFCIRNQGQEIPAEVLEHFFEPEIWDNSRIEDGLSGSGVGIAVVKRLIDLMGGSAEIRSENSEVTVKVRLPLPAVQETGSAPAAGDTLGALSLLVVDDNEINREIAQLLLTGEGFEVTLANDGAEAVEAVKASGGRFDAVLMDVQMPAMNGYEATAAIRALPDPALAKIPVIAMTANVYQGNKNEATEAGMDGYVPKPINADEIRAALQKALSR